MVPDNSTHPIPPGEVRYDISLLTPDDLHLFNAGKHYRLYEKLGSHPMTVNAVGGVYFAVWAPNAGTVSVVGDFNGWNNLSHPLRPRDQSGIWEGFIPGISAGQIYKYHIESRIGGYHVDKADPFGLLHETPPRTASRVWDLNYEWSDQNWMSRRQQANSFPGPFSIYELHVGSWKMALGKKKRHLSYRELAPDLAEYVSRLGFTHVELLPVMEHPFAGSWGYQTTGYFAPTSRFGTPQDLMYLIDYLHRYGIGVILDWVPSHFPVDRHGLGFFDGTHLYEHADPRQGFHPDWSSFIFNYGRHEVQAFLVSNGLFWLDKYHVDGLRVDGVASMLYLDYSRKDKEWLPNEFGGRENLAAVTFLKEFNTQIYRNFPSVQTIAEESTSWPLVSRPIYLGGLGFGMKWDLGWMHDTLAYFTQDPIFRKHYQNNLTFRLLYAFTENFVLPLSHDEVVHGKGSLLAKMPGDDDNKFANLRLLFAYMFAQPGKKLIFMGGEFGQRKEWAHDECLEWNLLDYPVHQGVQKWVQDLNRVYRTEKAFWELDFDPAGFQWIDVADIEQSTISLLRKARQPDEVILAVFNFTPVLRAHYRVGVPFGGDWQEILNSDALEYHGRGYGNLGGKAAESVPFHGQQFSLDLTLPPLGALFLKHK
jgi:1,4-alpha-glucan branching enzyme